MPTQPEHVILLHGLWMRGYAMRLLARRLRRAGFTTEIFHYPTLRQSPLQAAQQLQQRMDAIGQNQHCCRRSDACRRDDRFDSLVATQASLLPGDRADVPGTVHLVGHSLGGVVALLATADRDQPGRNLCLGSPLTECETARRLNRYAPVLMGKSGGTLMQGLAPWSGSRPVGVIAGSTAFGLGLLVGRLEGANDGTVRVAETRLPGIADHLVLPASHTGLPFLRSTATQTIHFLRHGQFVQQQASCSPRPLVGEGPGERGS